MKFTRRHLLGTGATAGVVSLAGCTGGCGQGFPLFGTNMPHDGEIAVTRKESIPQQSTLLQFSDLPEAERTLLRTAIQEGVARVCMDEEGSRTSALHSFANRVNVEATYLEYEDNQYGLWVRIEDTIQAGTADAPKNDENPCC